MTQINEEACRKAFEEWCRQNGQTGDIATDQNGNYFDSTNAEWKAWQAAWNHLTANREASGAEVIEPVAESIYGAMVYAARTYEGNPPNWQTSGNSFAQDRAREAARKVLSDIVSIRAEKTELEKGWLKRQAELAERDFAQLPDWMQHALENDDDHAD